MSAEDFFSYSQCIIRKGIMSVKKSWEDILAAFQLYKHRIMFLGLA